MSEYGKFTSIIYDPFLYIPLIRIRNKIVSTAKELKSKKIIDLCCGTGNQLKYLHKNGFTESIGVDISETMMQQATKGKVKAKCYKQDATNTSFNENSFDTVIITFALHEKSISVAQDIITEAFRLLHDKGNLLIVDYLFDKNSTFMGRTGVKIIEKLAGGEHYRNFKDYIKRGALDYLMKNYSFKTEHFFLYGAVRLRVYQIVKKKIKKI